MPKAKKRKAVPGRAVPVLPSALKLLTGSFGHLKKNWKLFGGILLIYILLNLVLVRGLGSTINLQAVKDNLQEAGYSDRYSTTATLYGSLLSSGGTSSETGGIYQSLLLIVGSLSFIWALRQTHLKKVPKDLRAKHAYYHGLFPLAPFTIVVVFLTLQLTPLIFGGGLYNTVLTNGIAATAIERTLWGIGFALVAGLSMYWLSGSILALYIVTLPAMEPRKATRSSRQLVKGRRLLIIRKLLFLPLVLCLAIGIIMLPALLFVAAFAEILFFLLASTALLFAHAYMYELYRSLL